MDISENISVENGFSEDTLRGGGHESDSEDSSGIGAYKKYMKTLLPYNEGWINNRLHSISTAEEYPKAIINGSNGHSDKTNSNYSIPENESSKNETSSTNGVDNEEIHTKENLHDKKIDSVSKNTDFDNIQSPFEIVLSDTVGRYLIARRDISAGEILLVEPPIAMATRPKSPPHCLTCYKNTNSFKCPECGFFLCGPECLTDSHKRECKFLTNLGVAVNSDEEKMKERIMHNRIQQMPEEMRAQAMEMIERANAASKEQKYQEIMQQYVIMAALRTLFTIQENEVHKNVFIAMQANLQPGSERYKMNQNLIVDVLINRLKATKDSELIHRICSVWDTNAFQVVLPQNGRVQGLFPLAGLINHDCRPNTQQWFTNTGEMVLRAISNIPKGSEISLSYTDPQWSTIVRQNHLQKCKQFTCTCKRCLDSTELGTFVGSLMCKQCSSPMTSSAPLDTTAKWVCTSSTCQHTLEAKQILSLGANLGALTQKLNPRDVSAVTSLAKLLQRQVHPNHYSLMQMYMSVIKALVDKDLADMSNEELCCLGNISSRLMEVTRVLQSPLARITATVAREDLRLRLEAIKRAEMKPGRDGGARKRLADMSSELNECVEVLRWDPSMPKAEPLLKEYQGLVNSL